jgi:hypothetical protein
MEAQARQSTWLRLLKRHAPSKRHLAFSAGLLCSLAVVLAAGEFYLIRFPPRELQPYLGNDSPLTGPLAPDDRLTVRYRSWNDFQTDYSQRLEFYQPLFATEARRPIWALFGNSFVHAPGMLGDTARDRITSRTIFYLARNEPLSVRLAQIELLLQRGIVPERIFFVILPIEVHAFALNSLDQIYVNDKGALTYRPRLPPGVLGTVVGGSRLALSAWMRTKLHQGVPGFRQSQINQPLTGTMRADMERILDDLRYITGPRGVPVTIVLIPNYEQITRGDSFELLDQLGELSRARGFHVCDTRDAFLTHPAPRRRELFIPDKHFSPVGNQMLLEAILNHLRTIGADPETIDRGRLGR